MDDGRDVTCLFCDRSFQTTCALWEHTKLTHQFDIISVKHRLRKFKSTLSLICYALATSIPLKSISCISKTKTFSTYYLNVGLDFYDYIKLINFIRAEVLTNISLELNLQLKGTVLILEHLCSKFCHVLIETGL